MSFALRIILVIASVCMFLFVLRGVGKSKMRIEDSLFWIMLSFLILILSIFPQIASWCAEVGGFMAPVNFIFLFFIFVLLIKGFFTSRQVSQLEGKIKELTQQIALDRLSHYERTHREETKDSHAEK